MTTRILLISLCLLLCCLPPALAADLQVSVSGRAFVDGNHNGKREAREAVLPGVIVSDGAQVTVTDAQGAYTLHGVNPVLDHFVFVVRPTGYRCLNSFYRRLPEQADSLTADFTFIPAPETAKTDFSFAQITDIHTTIESQTLLDDLREIARLKPAFVIATGDLVDAGGVKVLYQRYLRAVAQSPVPVISGIGNHDEWQNGIVTFEELLGPTNYAFDYGGRHFVLFDSSNSELPRRYEWLRRELALQPKEKEIYFFQHTQPEPQLLELLSAFNTMAIFSGHAHCSKVGYYGTRPILSVNTPTLRFGGIDTSPREFRLITFAGGKMDLETRVGGVRRFCAVVSPAEDAVLPQGALPISVSAYDSGLHCETVLYRLDAGRWEPLQAAGSFNWSGSATVLPGKHSLQVRATFAGGTAVERRVRFTVDARERPAPQPGQDWPTYQHDPARSGSTADVAAPPLAPAWHTSLGGVTQTASPVVAGGLVFLGVADDDGRGKAGVYALDARTGEPRWHFPTAASVKQTVAVAGGLAYAACVDGAIYALDAATGEERWHYNLGDSPKQWAIPAPLVLDGKVYVGLGGSFRVLDALTGQVLQQNRRVGVDWLSGPSAPAADAGTLIVGGSWNRGVAALDRGTGALVWKSDGYTHTFATPVLGDGLALFPSAGRLRALDLQTGADRWSFPLPGDWTVSSPALAGGKVLIGTGDGRLYALDVAGTECWRFEIGPALLAFYPYSRTWNPVATPAVSGHTVYVGGTDGTLYALNLETGEKLWAYPCGAPITSAPAICGNTVYVSTYDGTVYAFTQMNP